MEKKIFANNNIKMPKEKKTPKSKITLNEQKEDVLGELESIKSKLKTQTYKSLQKKILKSKKRGLTILSKDFKLIFDTETDTKKLTLPKLKKEIKEIKMQKTTEAKFKNKFKQFEEDNKKIEFDKIKPKDLEYILNRS